MHRILVVDDEPIIADGLREELLLEEDLDIDVYRTYSGKGALELLGTHRFDIVVTDIRMPGIDGLSLLERIRANWPECRVVFLTGHREFDYIYEATKYRGLQYVLKADGYARVIEAVRQAISEIDAESRLTDEIENLRHRRDSALMFVQKEYLQHLIDHRGTTANRRSDLEECDIDLDSELRVMMAIGRLDAPLRREGLQEFARSARIVHLASMQHLSRRLVIHCIPDSQGDFVLLAQPRELRALDGRVAQEACWMNAILFLKETLDLVQDSVRRNLGHGISFCQTNAPFSWESLPSRYETIKRRLDSLDEAQTEALLVEEESAGTEPPTDLGAGLPYHPRAILDGLSMLLDRGERDAYLRRFDQVVRSLEQCTGRQEGLASEIFHSLALMLLSYMNRWGLFDRVTLRIDPCGILNSSSGTTLLAGTRQLRKISLALFDLREQEQDKRATDILNRLKAYVDAHIGDDLSLFRLSELVHFNPSYLSRLFKQLSHENLTDYIQNRRIEKAKELLFKPDVRVAEIAAAVGFGSSTNFTRFFRKSTGMTPLEYRERNLSGQSGNPM